MVDDVRYVLAMDSAVNSCGVCVYDAKQGDAVAKAMEPMSRGQAEALIPLVEGVVNQAGIEFRDIDLIATTIGPGTFSGLRVGLSAAKSYSLALNVPAVGVSTLDLLAQNYFKQKGGNVDLGVLIESKRQDFYFQLFNSSQEAIVDPIALSDEDIIQHLKQKPSHIIGDGCKRFLSGSKDKTSKIEYIDGFDFPDPQMLAEMALNKFRCGEAGGNLKPLYLRGADVSAPKNKPRTLEAL